MASAALPAVTPAHISHVQAGERMAERRTPTGLIQLASDLGVRSAGRQVPNKRQRRGWRLERTVARPRPLNLEGGHGARAPVNLDRDLARLRHTVEVHTRDGEAQQ